MLRSPPCSTQMSALILSSKNFCLTSSSPSRPVQDGAKCWFVTRLNEEMDRWQAMIEGRRQLLIGDQVAHCNANFTCQLKLESCTGSIIITNQTIIPCHSLKQTLPGRKIHFRFKDRQIQDRRIESLLPSQQWSGQSGSNRRVSYETTNGRLGIVSPSRESTSSKKSSSI